MNAKTRGRTRSGARELLSQALYQWQLTGHSLEELLRQFEQRAEFKQIDASYFNKLLTDILQHSGELIALIESYADRGPKELDPMGRAVLLIGLGELKLRPDVPTKVVINEAVNLAKRYGATDGHRFVNALLDRAADELREPRVGDGDGRV